MTPIESLAHLAKPWADAYANSKLLMDGVTFLHVAGFLVAGGLAISADRAVFRAARADDLTRRVQVSELNAVHVPVLAGLALAFLTGLLLFLADVETFATSPVFWVKMGFLVLLLGNGAVLSRAGHRFANGDAGEGNWKVLRRTAAASSALWLVAVLTGVMLVNL
jgi:uncharacterized membrane protein